jgi:hypothetical protein
MIKLPYNRIISYGCSFTAGTELGTAEFLGITEEEMHKLVKKHSSPSLWHMLRKSKNLSDSDADELEEKITKHSLTKSWPNYVAKYFDVPLVNRGIGGSSLSFIVSRILTDLHNSDIKDDDLILVGLPASARWFQYKDDGTSVYGVFGHPWINSQSFDPMYQQQVEQHFFNNHNMFYNYCKDITFLSLLSDKLNSRIKICCAMITEERHRKVYHEELKQQHFNDHFNMCFDIAKLSNHYISETDCLWPDGEAARINPASHHIFGHPRVKYHEQFANILIKKLEEMYSD